MASGVVPNYDDEDPIANYCSTECRDAKGDFIMEVDEEILYDWWKGSALPHHLISHG